MIAINPLASFGARNMQPVRPVTPVVRGFGNAAEPSKKATSPSNNDKVTLSGSSPRAGDGLYTRKGTLVSSTQRQESFDLTIQTAEGDTATLHLSQSQGNTSTVKAQSSAKGSFVESLQEQYGALDVQISVKGSLNANEQKAIDSLIQDVNGVANTFFSGDLQAANTQADALNIQDPALSGFSLNLRSQEMSRVSAVYEDVAQFTAAPSSASASTSTPAPMPSPKATSSQLTNANLLNSLKQLFADLVAPLQNASQVTDAVDNTTSILA
jgi:hypothetical protein